VLPAGAAEPKGRPFRDSQRGEGKEKAADQRKEISLLRDKIAYLIFSRSSLPYQNIICLIVSYLTYLGLDPLLSFPLGGWRWI